LITDTEIPKFSRSRSAIRRTVCRPPSLSLVEVAIMHNGQPRAAASRAAQSTAFDDPGDPSYATTTLVRSPAYCGATGDALAIVIA
jgi:hypothetical protein